MDAAKLLTNINQRHGTSLVLAGRYGSGEQGAFKIVDETGARYILKFADTKEFQPANAASVTARLRGLGYPAPDHLLVGNHEGTSYSVQHEMRGAPIRQRIQMALLPQLLHLNDLQRGQGDSKNDAPELLIRSVMEGPRSSVSSRPSVHFRPRPRRCSMRYRKLSSVIAPSVPSATT